MADEYISEIPVSLFIMNKSWKIIFFVKQGYISLVKWQYIMNERWPGTRKIWCCWHFQQSLWMFSSTSVISIYSPVTTTYFYFHGYGDIVNDIEDLPSHKSTLSQYIVIFYKFFEPLGAESSFNCYGTPLAESPP